MDMSAMLAKLNPTEGGERGGGHYLRNAETGATAWVKDDWMEHTSIPMFKQLAETEQHPKGETNMTTGGISNEELLRKATLLSATDLATPGDSSHGELSVEQSDQFLQLMSDKGSILPLVTTVSSKARRWQENLLDAGARMLRPGVEETVGATTKPVLSSVDLSASLFKCVVPVSDEAQEDVRGDLMAGVVNIVTDRVAFDVADLALNSKPANDDYNDNNVVYDQLPNDGWLPQIEANASYDASSDGQSYQDIFRALLAQVPSRFKRNKANFKYFVPVVLEEKYRDALSSRGTALGDLALTGNEVVKYQSSEIVPTPEMYVRTSSSPDHTHILFCDPKSLVIGYHRAVRVEPWRDVLAGVDYRVITVRFDVVVPNPEACALATNVDVDA